MNTSNAQRRPEEGIQETWLVRREETAYEFNADSNNSQPLGRNFQGSKYEQIGSYRSTSQGEDAGVSLICGGEDPGKISERLKLIEQSFLSYVRSNQVRLEAELDHNRTLEQNFLVAIRQLEREIDSLVPREPSNHSDLDTQDTE